MTTSQILFLVGVACGLFFAGVCLWAQRDHGPFGKRWWSVPGGMFLVGVAFGAMAFLLDSDVADETLFEVEVPGSAQAVPAVHTWEIDVEHPEARHELGVYLNADFNVETPADVRVQLVDPLGRVLIDAQETLEPRCDGRSWNCSWDSYTAEFFPPLDGEMRLTVTLLTPDVPSLHVRVGDEEKTDGQRIPGY